MAVSIANNTRKLTLSLLILLSLGMADLLAQSHYGHGNTLSGNINEFKSDDGKFYSSTHVSAIGTDWVTVDDATNFAIGDTVLLIQMQGVGILTDFYGGYGKSFGNPGGYEFLIIKDHTPPNTFVFGNNIINAYDAIGNIQLVRVPYFNSATVKNDSLFCDSWDGSKGGVLALIIGRSLTLESDINLSGLGLRGGLNNLSGAGICQFDGSITSDFYDANSDKAGLKGEGIAIHDKDGALLFPDKARGKGANYTGGGGGNGKYSGGGGGSNRGMGGTGGYENENCSNVLAGGFGGSPATAFQPTLAERLFSGGGGGASTSASGHGGSGGNGGGIIIIVTDTLISKGGKILVNGRQGADGYTDGGAGGGGAGGSIAISLMSYGPAADTILLSAKGGNGGNNPSLNPFGEGGGGGGGLIYVNKPTAVNVTTSLNGGTSQGGTDGAIGEKKEDFSVVLNGFLFNSIRSSVTNNDKDTICSKSNPPLMTGTTPIGGTGDYTFQWQISDDDLNWSDISEATNPEYDPGVDFDPELATISAKYYRRIVSDGVLIDKSKSVKFTILPYIKGNTIKADATICYGTDPDPLTTAVAITDGNGQYKFRWQSSTDGSTFTDLASGNAEAYDPPIHTDTLRYHYQRIVTSGRCVNTSAPVSIKVLPSITGNSILNNKPEICNGMTFDNLTQSTLVNLKGGDRTFRYKWEGNINGEGWKDAPGTINLAYYDPTELAQKIPYNIYKFMRVVYSGPGDVCSSVSNEITLKDYAKITNNLISSPQPTICSGGIPVLIGDKPEHGDTTDYRYTWQFRKAADATWSNTVAVESAADRDCPPQPALADSTWYRRIVNSNACSDISAALMINVHKPLDNTISLLSGLTDTTICNGQDPFPLKGNVATGGTNIPGEYTYQWKDSTITGTSKVITSATPTWCDPPPLTETTFYIRQVVSGACTKNDTVKITVLPLITGNTFNQDQTICLNTAPVQLTAKVTGGDDKNYIYNWEQSTDGNSWSAVSGTPNTDSYSPPPLTSPMKYRRTVISGPANCCSSVSDTIDISFYSNQLPTGAIVNAVKDTVIFAKTPVSVGLNLTGASPWKVTLSENDMPDDPREISINNPVLEFTPEITADQSHFTYKIVKVEDSYGCLASSLTGEIIVDFFDNTMFDLPWQGFSPNGDRENETFEIKGLDSVTLKKLDAELSIVNSAGTEVFRTSNSGGQTWTNWDGRNEKGADLPEGTYYYLLKVRFPDSSVFRKSGFVILKRK